MSLRRLFLASIPLAGALILSITLARPSRGVSQQPLAVVRPAETDRLALVGTGSCSARGCHGSIEPRAGHTSQQNEFAQWVRDPHADAYQVLFDERSRRIAELLGGPPAHEDPRCLACHTNPIAARLAEKSSLAREERRYGVGCESCHEGANHWLVPHTTEAWSRHGPAEKLAHRMKDIADPAVQASVCAGCHVGAPPQNGLPARDVNHDLIAAGHPRLQFEFGAFQANMPPHWRPKKRAEGHFWAVGQIASAVAALELLAHRALDTDKGPWPEFAEYDCSSCHHDLTAPSWRQHGQRGKRAPGSLSWGSWYFALTPQLAGDLPTLENLEQTMQARSPDRPQAALRARAAVKELKAAANRLGTEKIDGDDGIRNRRLIRDLIKKSSRVSSWDSAEQLYLALNALNHSLADPEITKLLKDLTPLRTLPAGFDSPRRFRPDDFFGKLKP